MLVFISDLHLTDGTTGANIQPGAIHVLAERLRYTALRASWRADGTYRPIERIDLVLLGDVLDILRSERWLAVDVRPWDDVNSPALIQTVGAIVDQILVHNARVCDGLRALATQGLVCVPPAGHNWQPVYQVPPQQVSVRTHYMVGNHDWLLHVPGPGYDLLRQKVAHQLALVNPLNAVFPHDPHESDLLLETFRRHRVVARHGDVFDPLNCTQDRNASSLGDAIVIQLITRFAFEVLRQLGSDAPPRLIAGLRELDNIRPVLLAPVWLEGLLERTCPNPAMRKYVKQSWDRLADDMLQLSMVRERDTWSPLDLVDGLERALKFSQRLSVGWASAVATWLNTLRGAKGPSYSEHALAEPDFRNRRARHIVYGHTHLAETVPLDASYADGYVLNQVYFNTGTWRRVYHQTQLAPADHEFLAVENMTYLAAFEGDERSGRPFETWTGTQGLAADGQASPFHMIARHAEHSGPNAAFPVPPPHFQALPQVRSAGPRG
jgi:UDP-2,3-diacylglucosamine pyrophosphatase LpxH